MTVGELIKTLEEFDPGTIVVVDGYEGGFDDPIISMEPVALNTNVTLDGDKKIEWRGRHSEPNYPRVPVPITEVVRIARGKYD